MSKHRIFAYQAILPSGYVNAEQEFGSSYVSPNFALEITSGNTLLLAAAATNQIAVAINGAMRWVSTPITLTVASGANPTLWDIFATSGETDYSAEDAGNFDYSFGLVAHVHGVGTGFPAGVTRTRVVAQCVTDGGAIQQVLNPPAPLGEAVPPVGTIVYFPVDITSLDNNGIDASPRWHRCNGISLSRAGNSALFNVIGVMFGSVDATHFTLPSITASLANVDNASGTTRVLAYIRVR